MYFYICSINWGKIYCEQQGFILFLLCVCQWRYNIHCLYICILKMPVWWNALRWDYSRHFQSSVTSHSGRSLRVCGTHAGSGENRLWYLWANQRITIGIIAVMNEINSFNDSITASMWLHSDHIFPQPLKIAGHRNPQYSDSVVMGVVLSVLNTEQAGWCTCTWTSLPLPPAHIKSTVGGLKVVG